MSVLDLDGFFGLHPSLAPLVPFYKMNQLAIVHAAGSPDPTRSHFDAQDYMESGTPGVKVTEDGWLDRAIGTIPEQNASPFRAVAIGPESSADAARQHRSNRVARSKAVQGATAVRRNEQCRAGRL